MLFRRSEEEKEVKEEKPPEVVQVVSPTVKKKPVTSADIMKKLEKKLKKYDIGLSCIVWLRVRGVIPLAVTCMSREAKTKSPVVGPRVVALSGVYAGPENDPIVKAQQLAARKKAIQDAGGDPSVLVR